MKYYGMVFGDYNGIDWDGLVDVFYKEEDCEQRIDEMDCGLDEYYECWEMDEEEVKKYWGDLKIS